MLTTNEALTCDDLARPLSLEAVLYFASGQIPTYEPGISTLRGKFVRVGEAMVLGATVDYGRRNHEGQLQYLKHYELLDYLGGLDGLSTLALETSAAEPRCGGMMTDAGSSMIIIDAKQEPIGLEISRSSLDFGRADEAGRQRTIQIAQALVGETISVTSV